MPATDLPVHAPSGDQGKLPEFTFRREANVPALRRDLKIIRVSFRLRKAWVVKDPLALQYYRWGEREHRLAMSLDGKRSLSQITEDLRKTHPEMRVEKSDLQTTLNLFLLTGLLQTEATAARQLHENVKQRKAARLRKTKWLGIASKLITFKITLFDPDLLLLRMSRRISFIWSRGALFVLLAMMALSAWLLFSDAGQLTERMPDILGWQNLLILWLVMIAVKVVHEFGHGLSCKHYGGEVHEMGAMFILFSPFLFCNATDSWTFREKKQRLIVTFGGIYLELFLAAVAAALWVLTPPGLFNQVCFNVMLVCSVMTIFFNVNPLMKFDGYYALSDLLEIPNLKERGDKALVSRVAGFFTGGEGVLRDPLVESTKGIVLTYALASYAWTFTMAYNILWVIGGMLQPYGLDRLAQSVAGLVLLVGIVAPPFMVAMHIKHLFKGDESGGLKRRVLRRGMLAALVLAAVLNIPLPVHIRSACAIDSAHRVRVTASVDGYIRKVAVEDGQQVKTGEVLGVLENPRLEIQLATLESETLAVRTQFDVAAQQGDKSNLSSLRGLAAQLEAAMAKMRQDAQGLKLQSPVDGQVIGRDFSMMEGHLLRRGELFCEVIPEGPLVVVVALDELSAGKVGLGQKAEFKLRSLPGASFHGSVLSVEAAPSTTFPHEALGQHAGGTVPSTMTASQTPGGSAQAMPTGTIYKARVAIDNPDGILRPGMSGRLRIDCGKRPLGKIMWDGITSMIRTDFRL